MIVDTYVTRKEAAAYLAKIGCPVSVHMLETMAAHNNAGSGPPFYRYRRTTVRYKLEDLDTWASQQVRKIK